MKNNIEPTNVLSNSHVKALDAIAKADDKIYWALDYLSSGVRRALEKKEQVIEDYTKQVTELKSQLEDATKLTKLKTVQPFTISYFVSSLTSNKFSAQAIQAYEEKYVQHLAIAAENELVIKHNTQVLNNLVKMFELIGLSTTITKYKTASSKTKITVDAEWWRELKESYISEHHPSYRLYITAEVERINTIARKEISSYFDQVKKQEELRSQELSKEKEARREAIVIAHTCLKFSLDPLEIATRGELDAALIERGYVPQNVINDLIKELKL